MKIDREMWDGLVAIEGIDGAGTTTLSRLLSETLKKRGRNFVCGCEPTPGPVGRLIREALAGRTPLEPKTLARLFTADRHEHLYGTDGIRKNLDSGVIYITDRYFFSSLAYQTLDADWEWVDELNADFPLPGHLIFLGIPVSDAMNRLSSRSSREIFEHTELQIRVSDAYKRSLDAYRNSGMKILELDSRNPPENLRNESLKFIEDLI
jgi:dTMP kinase